MKLSNILLEGLTLFLVDILIKTDKDINKVEVYNQIRAIENVVVVTVEQNDFLQSKSTDQFDYEMLHLKFLASAEPKEVIKIIEELYIDKSKRDKRVIVSAIFYILCDTEFIKSPNAYYEYFQGLKEPTYTE